MSESDFRQRLVAILAADAAGYSRLMAGDDRATVAALDAARAVFRQHIETHGGRVIDMAGDSVLAVFETATGAVAAALAIQSALHAAQASVPEERQMRFRIGVHLGDNIEKADGSVYGDGVNIAARLQSLADIGAIMVSDAVHGAVRGKVAASFEDRGEQSVKNIAHPVRTFALGPASAQAVPASPATAAPAEHPADGTDAGNSTSVSRTSIAVLPFTNMSGDPEQDYFADGMVEDIITALARMGAFFVVARNSSFVYKGRAVDIKQVGRELGVRYVLEGSVRKAGNRVRITGQLIEAESGLHVWADRFEGSLDDVFELQDRITEAITIAIEPSLVRAEIARARSVPASNLQAYDLVLRALSGLMPGTTREAKDQTMEYIRQALQKDPHYAMAHALGSFACMSRIGDGYATADDMKAGLRHAERALAGANDHPGILAYGGMGLGALGYRAMGIRLLGFRYDEAEHAIERALSLSPNLLSVQFAASVVKTILGDGEGALAHCERAMRISPLDPGMGAFVAFAGGAHLLCGRFEQALAMGQRALRESPHFTSAHRLLIVAYASLGRMDEAKLAAQQMMLIAPDFTVSRYEHVIPFRDPAMRKHNAELFIAAGVPK